MTTECNININNIIIRKKEILSEISIFQKKIITLETELIQLEHKIASFSNNSISDNLVLNDRSNVQNSLNDLVDNSMAQGSININVSAFEKLKEENNNP